MVISLKPAAPVCQQKITVKAMRKILNKEDVQYLVVGCTHTSMRQDLSPDEIRRSALKKGIKDTGYHAIITRDGGIHGGVPINKVGTHTSRFDNISIGILMVGGKTTRGKPSDNYTEAQKQSLGIFLRHCAEYWPDAQVVGQGELIGGASPHFNVRDI